MPELQKDDMSFLSRSFERHFNERPYLKHSLLSLPDQDDEGT